MRVVCYTDITIQCWNPTDCNTETNLCGTSYVFVDYYDRSGSKVGGSRERGRGFACTSVEGKNRNSIVYRNGKLFRSVYDRAKGQLSREV